MRAFSSSAEMVEEAGDVGAPRSPELAGVGATEGAEGEGTGIAGKSCAAARLAAARSAIIGSAGQPNLCQDDRNIEKNPFFVEKRQACADPWHDAGTSRTALVCRLRVKRTAN